jgi:hypothetical protein
MFLLFYTRGATMNKLTPGSNKLYEGSRFMLTAHREAIIGRIKKQEIQSRRPPMLDEQAITEFGYQLYESLQTKNRVTVKYYTKNEDVSVSGVITAIGKGNDRVKLEEDAEEFHWINIRDIINVN